MAYFLFWTLIKHAEITLSLYLANDVPENQFNVKLLWNALSLNDSSFFLREIIS